MLGIMDSSALSRYLDYTKMRQLLRGAENDAELFEKIVNTPFHGRVSAAFMGLGICVLLLKNTKSNMINPVALSRTEQAEDSMRRSAKPFKAIKIPADYDENIVVRAIKTGQAQQTDDWQYLFVPGLRPEDARMNQAGAGIGCSVVYPVDTREGGAIIFSYFVSPEEITPSHHKFMKAYSELAAKVLRRP